MTTFQIACKIGTTDANAKLALEIYIDDRLLWATDHVTKTTPLTFDIEEDDAEHVLRFVMTNKTDKHTTIDETGKITTDARLTVTDLAFDEIQLKQIFIEKSIYTHDFNGTKDLVNQRFYGEMGCNGTVSLAFSSPIYLWLLENM